MLKYDRALCQKKKNADAMHPFIYPLVVFEFSAPEGLVVRKEN